MVTNFAFIMDLLKISSKKFLEIGFDRTLVSRWRRGKLRLMPNRYIVQSIAALFWSVDQERTQPILEKVLNIWYPLDPCNTKVEKQSLLERFLTERGQLEDGYEARREKRLGKITCGLETEQSIETKGIDAAKLRILDFLELILALPKPTLIDSVYPQGRGTMLADGDFNACLLDRYEKLFENGHRMNSAIRSDGDISDFVSSYNSRLVHLLKGYGRNQYFNDYNATATELFLAVANDSVAIELIEEEPGRIESTISNIYTDQEHVENIKMRIQDYFSRSKPREYFDFFEKPDNYLKYVHISPDSPSYLITRLPHFGILPEDDFAASFSLNKAEAEFTNQEIRPLMLNPSFFWEYATVRHIFCESTIENALLKKRHQSLELSKMLKRRVWMSTPHLVQQLMEIQNLLKKHKNYEVCFLNEERFEELKVQMAVWGYGASIVWIDNLHSAASRGYVNQRIMQGFCQAAWDHIPDKTKSRVSAMHKIEQWLEKARRYGYELERE